MSSTFRSAIPVLAEFHVIPSFDEMNTPSHVPPKSSGDGVLACVTAKVVVIPWIGVATHWP
jgi:hypothetical protein